MIKADLRTIFSDLVDQWGTFLVAKLCLTSATPLETLESKISNQPKSKGIFEGGYQMATKNSLENVTMMSKTVELIIYQFHSHSLFPQLFSDLLKTMNVIFSSNISEIAKRSKEKALHTEKMVAAEKLTDMDNVCIDVFKYLSSILDSAATCEEVNFSEITIDSISIVFNYAEHYLPSSVRLNAGKILSSLSASAQHADMICDMFWKKFGSLKKDNDFRNFSTWIDGVVNLQLSLRGPDLTKTSASFLSQFIENTKKIQRGVLRMKFLSCLAGVLARINKSSNVESNSEIVAHMEEIWNIALKWSTKQKHHIFCLEFLGQLMITSYPNFFVGHAAQFFELLFKSTKALNGDVALLKVILSTYKNMPNAWYSDHFAEFKANVDTQLIPLFFKTQEKIKKSRFVEPEQNRIVVQTLVEIGKKQLLPIVDFIRSIFGDVTQEENVKGRMTCLEVLSELARALPNEIEKFNNELFPYIQPMLLRTTHNPDEIEFAVFTFPLIHPHDNTVLARISQVLFDVSIGDKVPLSSSAFMSLTSYIEKLITFEKNSLSPLNYMSALLKAIPTLPRNAIIDKMTYLYGILHSYGIAMNKSMDKIETIKQGGCPMTVDDWLSFRDQLDKMMLPLLFYPDADVSNAADELLRELSVESLHALDINCYPEGYYLLSNALVDTNSKDYFAMVSLLQEKNPELIQKLFASTVELWKLNPTRLDEAYTNKIMHLLSAIARVGMADVPQFFEQMFQLLKQTPNDIKTLQCLPKLVPDLWIPLINELNRWMTINGLTVASFWQQFTAIYYAIANHPQFKSMLEREPTIVEAYERYIVSLWKTPHENEVDSYVSCEKGLKILTLYVTQSPCHFTRILEASESNFDNFIVAIQHFVNYSQATMFTATFLDSWLTAMITVFEYAVLDGYTMLNGFMKWLHEFDKFCEAKEQCQILIVKLLTMILARNPPLIRLFFRCSFVKDAAFAAKFLLAMSNVYKRRESDFDKVYKDGAAILLAAALLHLRNDNPVPRQAAHKLMCLMVSSEKTVFTNEIQTELMMSLTSYSPAGYVTQTQHFLGFISKSITSAMAVSIFKLFSIDLCGIEIPQAPILYALDDLLPLMVKGCSLEESARLLLCISNYAKLSETDVAVEIKKLWCHYMNEINEESVPELIDFIFKYTVEQPDLKSVETIVGINTLIFIYFKYPRLIANLLIPILCTYDRSIPSDVHEFLQCLESPEVDFSISKKEVVAYNALSQILLLIEDKELFDSLFVEKLPQLTFFAIIMFANDEFSIGPFHPLLDTLLDAALFRFAKDQETFSRNIQTLQASNLVHKAASIDLQYQITTDATQQKHMLAYDQNAIIVITKILQQTDPQFTVKFFNILLANAFRVKRCEREIEPFLMIMALNNEMTTSTLYRILMFAISAFTHDRKELLDSLADIARQRLLSESLDEATFAVEVVPVIIVFLLYLCLDCKRSFSIHIIRILGDLCRKVSQYEGRDALSAELNEFMSQCGSDEYISSLFVRFLVDVPSFGDPSVRDIIAGLYEIGTVMGMSANAPNNWCHLVAILTDGIRYFIGKKSSRPIDPVLTLDGFELTTIDAFTVFLKERFNDVRQQIFVVQFIGAFMKDFKTLDLSKDTVAMEMINCFLSHTDLRMEPRLRDSVVKTAVLLGLSGDENGIKEAAKLVAGLVVSQGDNVIGRDCLAIDEIKPQFKEVTLKPIGHYQPYKKVMIDQASLPAFRMYQLSSSSTQEIVDLLTCYISTKVMSVQ